MTDANKSQQGCLVWLWLSILIVVLDQGLKYLASTFLSYGEPLALLPVFDLTLLHNPGAAFSFLASQGGWQRWFLAAVAVGMSIYLIIWLKKTPRSMRLQALALALVLGGALGNLIDRVWLGYVVDYIALHWKHYYYPAFNLADVAITLGAVLLIWDMVIVSRRTDSQTQ